MRVPINLRRGARLLQELIGKISLDHNAVRVEELGLHEWRSGNCTSDAWNPGSVQAAQQRRQTSAGEGDMIERTGGERGRSALQEMQHSLFPTVEPTAVQRLSRTGPRRESHDLLIESNGLIELLSSNIEVV